MAHIEWVRDSFQNEKLGTSTQRNAHTQWISHQGVYRHALAPATSPCLCISRVQITWCLCAELLQSRVTPSNSMDCSPADSSVHGILQARILEWVALPTSRGSSWPKNWTCLSYIGKWILYHGASTETQHYSYLFKRVPEKHLFLLYWLYQCLRQYGSQ